ncbi:glyceraldehyde 3-phosphate reductase [Sphaerisporangium siamense]|uniref:Aryl-alcohol dehydrogenase-like predicted oxidoreductase n=1 Tax=Sphaerisporangium siamense TaxID=795645 RepID=A0A7W7D678_9ACTN|nr:aldo/keto reductase [Sphaerisporangium siamense]MBB4701054.1 aryl-alcohol dehydrogenase-like predicted oxidoreductase [Sphaerisporangium siamense]GII85801.1 glyceraldehyde 3-phosphate reductase [Sphaerisporangium siamense]
MASDTPKVFTRPLGGDGFRVPALTVGSWHTWDRTPFEETVDVIRTAADAGAAYFDVGVYRADLGDVGSHTDVIFGRAVQAAGVARDDYVLQVKSWVERSGTADDIVAQFDRAVFRVGTDHAEIVVFGDLVGEHVPYEVIAEGAAALVESGRVRHWAVNNWSVTEIRAVAAAAERTGLVPPAFAQLKYNVVRRSIAEGEPFRGVIADLGLKVQASDALEGGFLLGNPRRRPTGNDPGGIHGLVEEARPRLRALAEELGGTLAQLALAYVLTNEDLCSVLIGARTTEQITDDLGAFDLLARAGADRLRESLAPYWLDKGRVDPESSWSSVPDDDPAKYALILPDA